MDDDWWLSLLLVSEEPFTLFELLIEPPPAPPSFTEERRRQRSEYDRAYYEKNRKRIIQRVKSYPRSESVRARQRAYSQSRPRAKTEKYKAQYLRYYAENRERILARIRHRKITV